MQKNAASLAEAIELVERGRKSGQWDLFRGQSNAAWEVTSTAERLSDTQREEALDQFKRFLSWADGVGAMKRYFANPDSLWAIGQHYGLKTNFIDFTSDPCVAAFFACESSEPAETNSQAAIICLNSRDFLEFWEKNGPFLLPGATNAEYPCLLKIDVDNLWRLQKQKGSFLWNPVYGIERIYNFDRIVFPSGAVDATLPKRQDIYPIHQSELEKLLTQFFMNEQMREGNRAIAGLKIRKVQAPVGSYEAISWRPEGVVQSDDWKDTDEWDRQHIEHSDFAMPGVEIWIDPLDPIEKISEMLCATLEPEFIQFNRSRTLEFRSDSEEMFEKAHSMLLSRVRRLWNGMRTLPYSASEISVAAKKTIELFPIALRSSNVKDAYGGDCLYVEMASRVDGYGAYSRASVTRNALIEAHNKDFLRAARMMLMSQNPRLQGVSELAIAPAVLMLAARPWERFTFSGLRRLMVEQLIPTQVVWRVPKEEGDLRTVIYFSPKDFSVFGLA